MIQTRVRSFSDRSSVPTHGLLFACSRSNSAAMAGGQAERSAWSLVFSSIVRAIAFPPRTSASIFGRIQKAPGDWQIVRSNEQGVGMLQRRALVIGGSMSGLLAALMLRRRGWQAEGYEGGPGEIAGRGGGIGGQAGAVARL